MARRIRRALAVIAIALGAAAPAAAQSWQEHNFPDAGFAVQLPGEPVLETGTFMAPGGIGVPAKIYALRLPNIVFTMTVADLTGTAADNRNVIDQEVRALGALGEMVVNISAEIDNQYGKELSISEKDGSRSIFAVFYIDHHLYELKGKSLPPNPERRSGDATRFQQSLRFARRRG